MEKIRNIVQTIVIILFIFAIVFIGSIDLDKTENAYRERKAEVSTSAYINNNI